MREDLFVAAAADVEAKALFRIAVPIAASQVVTIESLAQFRRARAASGRCGLWFLQLLRLRLSRPLLEGSSSSTLARMSSAIRLEPSARRRLTNRCSEHAAIRFSIVRRASHRDQSASFSLAVPRVAELNR
jgi:hypothetical protein